MSEISINKEKPKYTTLKNTIYLIHNIWKWDKVLFFLCIIQIPVTVAIPLVGIYLPKILIDSVTSNLGPMQLIVRIGIPILALIILTIILKMISEVTKVKGSISRLKYIQMQVDKVIDTDFENIDGPKGQEKFMKATVAINSSNSATDAISGTGVELISNIIGFFLYAGIISTLNPLIVIFIIISSLINYFVGLSVSKYEHKNKDNLTPLEKKLRYIREKTGDFKSAKDMRLYNMSVWFKDMYNIFLNKRLYFERKDIYRRYFSNIVDGILIFFRDGIAYGFLIYSVIYRDMPIGNFILYFGAIAGFSTWLSGIVKNLNSLNSMSLNICDLREHLEMEDRMNRGQGVALPSLNELPCDIEIRGLYYKYPGAENYTIENLNLHIKKGEKLALVGVNGAGKTTLVKLICGLYTPTKGEIRINGKSSTLYNRDEYYTLFSVVFQDIHLLPVSIEKNISLQLEDNIDKEKMEKVIKMSGLEGKLKSLPDGKETLLVKSVFDGAIELSGGEVQKLMLARALYKGGPIIILDEPTAALDPIAENEVYQKYNELTKDHTSVFISHRLSSTRFCDRIIYLEDGKIIEEGNHYELMTRGGKYKEMFHMQSHYYKDNIGGAQHE